MSKAIIQRLNVEIRILSFALKQSFDDGDVEGCLSAHRELATAMQHKARLQATFQRIEREALKPKAPLKAGQISLYESLDLNPLSSFEEIHLQFLKLIKCALRNQLENNLTKRQLSEKVMTLCVAHDILKDPSARADYDFRCLGLRKKGAPEELSQAPDDKKSDKGTNKNWIKIGEILECSQVLDAEELIVALDMHKAMPEVPFGQFLVRQGFLSTEELEDALSGQKLIGEGKITVGQFQVAMSDKRANPMPLMDILSSRGWAT